MQRYFFDLIDTTSVTDAGGALLENDNHARKVARELVHDVRKSRPELIGRGYTVVVRSQAGDEIMRAAVDTTDGEGP